MIREEADIPEDGKREAILIQRGGARKTGLGRRRASPTTAGGGKSQVSSARRSEVNLQRQKKIRIADRSENGWATVKEYEEDELAENSDDEKRYLCAMVG